MKHQIISAQHYSKLKFWMIDCINNHRYNVSGSIKEILYEGDDPNILPNSELIELLDKAFYDIIKNNFSIYNKCKPKSVPKAKAGKGYLLEKRVYLSINNYEAIHIINVIYRECNPRWIENTTHRDYQLHAFFRLAAQEIALHTICDDVDEFWKNNEIVKEYNS